MFFGLNAAQQAALEAYYPQGTGFLAGTDVFVETRGAGLEVTVRQSRAVLRLERPELFGRGLLLLEDALALGGDCRLCETPSYRELGMLLDCSRNAIPTFGTFCRLAVSLSKMGYTTLQLYMEDTYQLEGYSYFGYRRGGYTEAELRRMDDFAAQLGLELVPAIQTLAHLGQSLKWKAFEPVRDLGDILLIDDENTYRLIGAMFASLARSFRSRRVNIGMDEAHLVGLGNYLRQHGYQDRMQLMLRHFDRVYRLARQHGFSVMLWSDMFFRLATGGDYYAPGCRVDPAIRAALPPDVTLIYWDYYSEDPALYDRMFQKHREMTQNLLFAGGAWKWLGYFPGNGFSMHVADLAHASCRKNGVERALVTAWADNGAECSPFAVLPTLQYWAELCYQNGPARLERHFSSCCQGADLQSFLCLDEPQYTPGNPKPGRVSVNPTKYLFYQDPLCGLFDAHLDPASYPAHFARCASLLAEARQKNPACWQYLFDTSLALCRVLEQKCALGRQLRQAYQAGDRAALQALQLEALPALRSSLRQFLALFHRQWLQENRAFGLDVIDLRVGGLLQRLDTAAERLGAYLGGAAQRLEELEEPLLPFEPGAAGQDLYVHYWHSMVSVSDLSLN